jgi:hypothetical protein
MKPDRTKWSRTRDGWLRYENLTAPLPFDVYVLPELVDGRWVIGELRLARADGISGGDLRQLRLDPVEAALSRVAPDMGFGEDDPGWFKNLQRRRYSLKRGLRAPAKRPYPDSFYRDVADSYFACIEGGVKPAPTLAEFWRVPITTVHGWIKEARQREILPPGRKGKAG